MNINGIERPLRIMELRSTYRWGGGPDKTILNSALMHDPAKLSTLVVYLRSDWDKEFSIGDKARGMGLRFEEIVEHGTIDIKAFRKIIALIKSNNIDILHSRDYKTNLYALIIRKFFCKNIKIVTTAHGWVGSGFKLSLYYTLDKILVASFDRNFILFKDMVKIFIRKPNPKTTRVIHNAIIPGQWDPAKYSSGKLHQELNIPANSKIISYVGRIMPEKDILTMVKVARKIIIEYKIDVYFVLIGESKDIKYDTAIMQLVSKYNIQDRFLFIGKRFELQQYYRDLDLFLMTSVQEGFPNSLLEAMAMKVPSIVSSIDGIPEIIENNINGILCKPFDVDGFSFAIEKLLNDTAIYNTIASNARKLVENELSFESRLRKMENEYEQLISNKQ
jgi:glycosyltransferase involved in cell wall biosynthesis